LAEIERRVVHGCQVQAVRPADRGDALFLG